MEIMREIHGYARTQFGPHGHLNTVSRHCPLPVCSTILYIADINKKNDRLPRFYGSLSNSVFCQISILGGSQSGI